MRNKQRGFLKKAVALITALLMVSAVVPAVLAESADQAETVITPAEAPTEAPTAEPTATPTEAPVMPIGEMVNRYAVTNTGELKFREQPNTKAKILGYLKKGENVWVLRTEPSEMGENWSMVIYGGKTGFIMSRYLNLLTREDSDIYNTAQESPVPVYTLEELFPTEAPTEVPTYTPEPTDTPTPAPTDPPTPEPTEAPEIREGEMINRYAVTNAGELKFRATPGTTRKDRILETIKKKGALVWLIRADFNEVNESWSLVRYKGKDGYIMTKYLDLLTQEDSDVYNSVQESPAPVVSPEELLRTKEPAAPEPTAAPQPEPTALPEISLSVEADFDRYTSDEFPVTVNLTIRVKNDSAVDLSDIQVLSDSTVLFSIDSIDAGQKALLIRDVLINSPGTYVFTAGCKGLTGEELWFESPGIVFDAGAQ